MREYYMLEWRISFSNDEIIARKFKVLRFQLYIFSTCMKKKCHESNQILAARTISNMYKKGKEAQTKYLESPSSLRLVKIKLVWRGWGETTFYTMLVDM